MNRTASAGTPQPERLFHTENQTKMKTDNPQTHAWTITLLLLIILLGALLLSTAGCRTIHDTQTIIRTDTVRIAARERLVYRTDTVRVTDRLYRNDTVYLRDSIRIKLWRDSVVHDTVVEKGQDVKVVKETKEVVKRSGYDRFCSCAFWIIVVIIVVGLVVYIARKYVALR